MDGPWEDQETWRALSFDDKCALIRSAIELPDLVEHLGFDVDRGGKARPPWNPDERTPSCSVYPDHFFDFASGRSGDHVDWIVAAYAAEGVEMTKGQAVNRLHQILQKSGREPGDVESVKPRQLQYLCSIDEMPGELVDKVCGWPAPYGARTDSGDIFIPHAEQVDRDVKVYGVKIRHAGRGKSAMPGSMFTHRLWHPGAWMALSGEKAIICEGETDALAMRAFAPDVYDVFALPSGASAWKDHWLTDLAGYTSIHICMDNDRAGKAARDKLTLKIGYAQAEQLYVPSLFNDAREALDAGWAPHLGG